MDHLWRQQVRARQREVIDLQVLMMFTAPFSEDMAEALFLRLALGGRWCREWTPGSVQYSDAFGSGWTYQLRG